MPTTEQILGSIEQRIRDLRGEIDALAAARAELVESRSGSRRRPRRTTRSGGSRNAGAAQAESTVSLRDAEQAVAKPKAIKRAPRKTAPAKPKPGETKRMRVSVAEAIAKAKRDYPAGTPLFSPEERQAMAKPKPTRRAQRKAAPAKPKPKPRSGIPKPGDEYRKVVTGFHARAKAAKGNKGGKGHRTILDEGRHGRLLGGSSVRTVSGGGFETNSRRH